MIIWPRRSPICSSTAPSGGAPRHRQNDGDPAQVYDGLTHEFGTTWCDRTTRRWRRSKWICCAASQPLRSEPLSRSEEHTSELQSLMRISYAVFCLKKNKIQTTITHYNHQYLAQIPNN